MSELKLTKIRLRNGCYEARISGADSIGTPPDVEVTYLDRPINEVAIHKTDLAGEWDLQFEIPKQAIADGVQTFLILDRASATKLGDLTLIAGEATADDLRGEFELLRAELDMLKRAFRRHCLETM